MLNSRYCHTASLSIAALQVTNKVGIPICFLQSGALPALLNLPSAEMRRNYVSAIKDTVMLRDIVKRYKVKDVKLLDDLFVYMVSNAGNIISVTNIINYFASQKRKTNYETLSSYIGYLENSFLIHRAERYNIKGKETISGNCKFYINDLGFHNYLYAGFGYGIGYLLECHLFGSDSCRLSDLCWYNKRQRG